MAETNRGQMMFGNMPEHHRRGRGCQTMKIAHRPAAVAADQAPSLRHHGNARKESSGTGRSKPGRSP